jgi:hypothetical protein
VVDAREKGGFHEVTLGRRVAESLVFGSGIFGTAVDGVLNMFLSSLL